MPEAQPVPCVPNFEKQDISTFRADVLKWKNWLTEDAYSQWVDLTKNNEITLDVPEKDPPLWPLDNLLPRQQGSTTERTCSIFNKEYAHTEVSRTCANYSKI